jgi:hypothetical protein
MDPCSVAVEELVWQKPLIDPISIGAAAGA